MICLNEDLGINYQDCGVWRSYQLETYGDTMEELWDNAVIAEIDQDGGELDCYGMGEAPSDVYEAADKLIKEKFISREVMKVWRVG